MQLAEEVGAAAVWVVNSGVSHRQSVAPSDLGPWLQARRCTSSILRHARRPASRPAIRRCDRGSISVPAQALLQASFGEADDEVITQRHSTVNHT